MIILYILMIFVMILLSNEAAAGTMASNASVLGNMTALWRPFDSNLSKDNSTYPVSINVPNDNVKYSGSVKQVGSASGFFPGFTTSIINYSSQGIGVYNVTMTSFCAGGWTNATVGNDFAAMMARKTAGQGVSEWAIQIDYPNNIVRCQYFTPSALHASAGTAALVADNTWKHIACVFNVTGGNVYEFLYINGTLSASNQVAVTQSIITTPFTIGGDSALSNGLSGGIDEVFLINNSANCHSDNILTIYQQGRQGLDYNSSTGIAVDNIGPMFNMTLNDTSLLQNDGVNVSVNASDDVGLSFCKFGINQTGIIEYYNKSVNGKNDKCSQNFTITIGAGSVINFSVSVNDTSNNINQTFQILTVDDSTPPQILSVLLSHNSITDGDNLNLTINCSDTQSNLNKINFTLKNPNGLLLNRTSPSNFEIPNVNTYILNYTIFGGSETSVVGLWNITSVGCEDTSLNSAYNSSVNLTFMVNATISPDGGTPTGGGGGGGAAKTIVIKEGIPLLSFGGLTLIDFNVLTTPSKKVKIIRFKNVGNFTFGNAKVSTEGNANKYVKPFVCNLNMQECLNESINIKAGESKFLVLNGTFTEEIRKGTSGAIRIQEQKINGNAHELNLLISRPPLYSIAVKPLVDAAGIPELLAFVIVYVSTAVIIIGSIWFTTLL